MPNPSINTDPERRGRLTSCVRLPPRIEAHIPDQIERQMKDGAGAGAYDRLTGRWSRLYAPAVLKAVGASLGSAVLDLATGTGDAALIAGRHVQASGTVIGVDISVPMLRVANSKSLTSNVRFIAADAMM